jgi:hypothetical protein
LQRWRCCESREADQLVLPYPSLAAEVISLQQTPASLVSAPNGALDPWIARSLEHNWQVPAHRQPMSFAMGRNSEPNSEPCGLPSISFGFHGLLAKAPAVPLTTALWGVPNLFHLINFLSCIIFIDEYSINSWHDLIILASDLSWY